MAEYIERKALIRDLIDRRNFFPAIVKRAIEEAPAADVQEVWHGRWVEYETPHIICCSECDWGTSVDEKSFNYCPNCGAKMRGEKDD